MKTVTVVQHHRTAVPVTSTPQSAAEFAIVLSEFAATIDTGRIHDRDLPTLAPAIAALVHLEFTGAVGAVWSAFRF